MNSLGYGGTLLHSYMRARLSRFLFLSLPICGEQSVSKDEKKERMRERKVVIAFEVRLWSVV